MPTEPTGVDAHHEDGLDIDFGIGVAQNEQMGRKDAGAGTALEVTALAMPSERAPSEINYDSDADVAHASKPPAAGPNGDFSRDEITWDDPEDEPVQDGTSQVPSVDDSHGAAEGTESRQDGALGDEMQEDADDDRAAMGPDMEDAGYYEDYDYDMEGQENSGAADFQGVNEKDAAESADRNDGENNEHGHHEEPDTIELDDDETGDDDVAVDEALAAEAYEDHPADADAVEDSSPDVEVLFAGNQYSLFRDDDDPDRPYILEDSLQRARASELLDALHDALGDELNDGDELVVLVEDLCLEISPMMASTLQSMSISDFVHLHNKLVWNDGSGNAVPLRLIIIARPSFSSRYQELLAGAKQGVGLSQLSRPFDTGQGVVYRSPVKNELGDIEYADDEQGYEQSVDEEEDEEEEEEEEEAEGQEDSNEMSTYEASGADGDDYDGDRPHPGEAAGYGEHDLENDEEYPYDGEGYDQGEYQEDEFGEHVYDDEQGYNAEQGHNAEQGYEAERGYEEAGDELEVDQAVDDGNDEQHKERSTDQADLLDLTVDSNTNIEAIAEADGIDWVDNPLEQDQHTVSVANEASQSASETIDGDGNVDEGLAVDAELGRPPAMDEISWEGDDDDNDVAGDVPVSANANGKRQHPGDDVDGDEAIDVKRRRSS